MSHKAGMDLNENIFAEDPVVAATTSSLESDCTGRRAEVSIIRCRTSGQCDIPEKLATGRIRVQTIATREAMLKWDSRIRTVLLVKKLHDMESARQIIALGGWMMVRAL